MKPAPFDHVRVSSLDEAVQALVDGDGDAKVLAGGQSLIPLLAMRLAQPTMLVDLAGLTELSYIKDAGDHLEIGAMTRSRTVETSPLVAQHVPLLPAALRHVGHVTIRNRGTLGGSVAHSDPAAEAPAVLRTMDAQVVVTGPDGQRVIPSTDFFHGFLYNDMADDELLTALRIPKSPPGTAVAVEELARRHGDFALVAVFGALSYNDAGRVVAAHIGVAGAASTPIRATAAEELLLGQPLSTELIQTAAHAVADATDPGSDIHAPAEYRRRMATVLARRALTRIQSSHPERNNAA